MKNILLFKFQYILLRVGQLPVLNYSSGDFDVCRDSQISVKFGTSR